MWVVSFTARPLYPRYPLYRRVDGLQSRSRRHVFQTEIADRILPRILVHYVASEMIFFVKSSVFWDIHECNVESFEKENSRTALGQFLALCIINEMLVCWTFSGISSSKCIGRIKEFACFLSRALGRKKFRFFCVACIYGKWKFFPLLFEVLFEIACF
jgi:hypothetical protein